MPLSPRASKGLVAVGAEVQLTSDAALAFQLAKGHGGWAPPMADCLGRRGTVVDVVNSQGDVRVNCGEYGSYVWNPASIVGTTTPQEGPSILALDFHSRRLYSSPEAIGTCGACRRVLHTSSGSGSGSGSKSGDEVHADSAASGVTILKPVVFCSRDGAFCLCCDCAAPYMDEPMGTSVSSELPAPLDCPGSHGLSDVTTHGYARCDACSRTLNATEMIRACRSCNWGVCPDCLSSAPRGARKPHMDIGSCCRAEWRGKPIRAVVVDTREAEGRSEVLLHYPGQSAEAHDEWIDVTSQRIVPVDPPTTSTKFHPAHRSGLATVRLLRGSEKWPKCTAEAKFPGGCRRHAAMIQGEVLPIPATGLYCERSEFFLCPWCCQGDLLEGASTAAGLTAAHRADVSALRDPLRCSDAATRIGQQCSRSVTALAGLLEAGAANAIAEALATPENDGAPCLSVLTLFLDLVEWFFNEPPPPSPGDRVLCERQDGLWHVGSVVEFISDKNMYLIEWGRGSNLSPEAQMSTHISQLRRLCGMGLAAEQHMRRRPVPRHGVPPPATLTRDYLIKKAIPSDNTAQARQYLMDGADLSTCSESGDTVLVLALEHGCTPKMVRLLLEFGCPLTPGAVLGEPLELAARYGQNENIELLLEARADPRSLSLEKLPLRAVQRIAPLATLLSVGNGSEVAVGHGVRFAAERTALASQALPKLVRLLARPPKDLECSSDLEGRLLAALDALLGAQHECMNMDDANDHAESGTACLTDLMEVAERLMATYSATAAQGALLLIRRLVAAGHRAQQELARYGASRFVARLAQGYTLFTVSGNGSQGVDSAFQVTRSCLEVALLAREVLRDIEAARIQTNPPMCTGLHQVAGKLGELASASKSCANAQFRTEVLIAIKDLASLLGSTVMAAGKGPSPYELEALEVPQALVTLIGSCAMSCNSFIQHLGNIETSNLASLLLHLVETTEELPVQPLPPYLSQAPGLRVLCEPLILVLLSKAEIMTGALQPYRPEELTRYWVQAEPLLKMQELERVMLLLMPVIDKHFLEWCVSLIGQDVAPRDTDHRNGAASGRVIDFHLATSLRIPVHTIRFFSDGREVDLVSSVHGLCGVGSEPPTQLSGLELRVAILRLEMATSPSEFELILVSLRAAVKARSAVVTTETAAASHVGLPCVAEEVLVALGFQRSEQLNDQWQCPGECKLASTFEDIISRDASRKGAGKALGSGALENIEPDPDLVMQLAAIFSENGAKRACAAVENASVEAAMTWACEHQGDADFNDPLPEAAARGRSAADPRAPVWSVFIVLPQGVPFDLVWPMLEEPVKGAMTSVANAWTAMGWAGGESEMRETLRSHVALAGEGPIARGLIRSKADRVASRLRNACKCRVDADPEGAAHAPHARSNSSGNSCSLSVGSRVQLVMEAEQLGFIATVSEANERVDVVTDNGRVLCALPADQVRLASQIPPSPATGERARPSGLVQALMQVTNDALTSVAEPVGAPPLAPLQHVFQALDRGAQESDVVRRFQPQDLLAPGAVAGCSQQNSTKLVRQPSPVCRMAFALTKPQEGGVDTAGLCLLRGERSWVRSTDTRAFSSTSWLTVGVPGLAVSRGSWYYEVKLTKFKNPQIGWADASFRFLVGAYSDDGIGDDNGSWAVDGERCCLWHKGRAGDWRSASSGQIISCAIAIDSHCQAQMWFAVDGVWDSEPVFKGAAPDTCLYPAVSGELDIQFHFNAEEMVYGPPDPSSFKPIGECQAGTETIQNSVEQLLPREWTVLQGICRLAGRGLAAAPVPCVLQSKVYVDFEDCPTTHNSSTTFAGSLCTKRAVANDTWTERPDREGSKNQVVLPRKALEEGEALAVGEEESNSVLEACGIQSAAARAALRLLREIQLALSGGASLIQIAPGKDADDTRRATKQGRSRRLGMKLSSHLSHPLACCAGAFPRWCRELPLLAPWLFPLEAREALLRCSAFGVTFAVRWFQEKAVDDRFAERRRNAEERLAQAKHIGDAALLNSAYESLFELQGQIARDPEAWVGSLKSELARVERDRVLQQAERAMELTRSSPCALEVQFEGESGFGRAVTQGFYTLVAHELQRRATNQAVPMWVEDDRPQSEDFLRPRLGLLVRPLPPDHPQLPEVEARFCMLGRLMAKALREGFVVPLPLTATFFQIMLRGASDPVAALPRPGDGVAGEFVGACAAMLADATSGPTGRLSEIAADPEWSRKYMQPVDEEPVPLAPFAAYAADAAFVETGLSGAPLCPNGANRPITTDNVEEFVKLAATFWLETGVKHQMIAFRRGLYDVLGGGAVMLWAFSAAELRRLFCGEDEVMWTEKELAEHLYCGGGFSPESEQVRWLREEMLAMEPPLRAKFLEFVTSCPRLPPGGLKELQLSVHPDPAEGAGFPRSRACAHRLFLPRYVSREELARQLHEAINSSGGHHEQQLPP